MPRVSILLPFRNAEVTLGAAIESMVGQSFADWELLLIDNASTDGSTAIACAHAQRDARIRVIAESTVGIAHALNTGLREAKESLIARMDADDISYPQRLEKQVAFLDAHPAIGVVGCLSEFSSTSDMSDGFDLFVQRQNALITPHEHYLKRFVDAPLAHPSVVFRKELVERHGHYDTAPLPEDHELWLRWMHHRVRFAKVPEVLLTWNDHPGRLTRTHAHYAPDAFDRMKSVWLAKWLARKFSGVRPIIAAGTSALSRTRAEWLTHNGVKVSAFTDLKQRDVPDDRWIPHDRLPPPGEAFIISFISQRGTGDRIVEYFRTLGYVEGEDFILAA